MEQYIIMMLPFLGLFIGVSLAHYAPEELENRHIFKILKYLLFGFISILFLINYISIYYGALSLISIFIVLYYFFKKKYSEEFSVSYLAIMLLFASNNFLVATASLISLFFIIVGTLVYDKHKRNSMRYIVRKYMYFVAIILIGFLIQRI